MLSPLAERLRPKELDDVTGQHHLLDNGKPLRRIIETGRIPNMVFYGPPGVGKTTVANIISNRTGRRLHKLNGTNASIADIRAVVDELDTLIAPQGVLLYLDEIQFFNKKQQQSLLEFIENGKITLITSTTENPYFYVYSAILSRSTVFEFKPLEKSDIVKPIKRAIELIEKENDIKISFSEDALDYLTSSCGGDVRKALNAVELLTFPFPGQKEISVNLEDTKEVTQRSSMRYDRDGDAHYDILSAFQKSIRGSDENAALHYLARLIIADDLPSICRRLLVIASEDIGLAYPQAVNITKACVDNALHLGFPEARLPLAQATILLATAPKSNSVICAIDAAMGDIQNGISGDIPVHIKDAHYSGAEKLGRGISYKYPHDYDNNYTEQQYLPDEIKNAKYYNYGYNKFESATKKYWDEIKKKKG